MAQGIRFSLIWVSLMRTINLLTTTQHRFLRAIESLTKVRRLARNTPSLQINIAQEGGQQVNVQGEVSGGKVL
jgi:hypothetical protein